MEASLTDDMRDDLRGSCKPAIAAVHADAEKNGSWDSTIKAYVTRMVSTLPEREERWEQYNKQRKEWEDAAKEWEKETPHRRLEYLRKTLRSKSGRKRLLLADGGKVPDGYALDGLYDHEIAFLRGKCVHVLDDEGEECNPRIWLMPVGLVNPPPVPPHPPGDDDPLDPANVPETPEAAMIRLALVESWVYPANSIIKKAMTLVEDTSCEWARLKFLQDVYGPGEDPHPRDLEQFFAPGSEDVAVEDELRRWFKLATGREFVEAVKPTAQSSGGEQEQKSPSDAPIEYLTSWYEITAALDLPHDQQGKVRSLNARFEGPIPKPRKGSQPLVPKGVLVDWWNNLYLQYEDTMNQLEGARVAAESQYDYGRDGVVAPEISGHVQKRRKDHKR